MKTAVSLSVVALVLSGIGLAPCWAVSPDKLEPQVEKLEKRIDSARRQLQSGLQNYRKSIVKRRDITPDQKRALQVVTDSAIRDFRSTYDLPDHPALVQISYDYAVKTQKIMFDAEKLRQQIVAQALEGNDVGDLERRVEAIAVGSDTFQAGQEWHGKRTYPDGAAQGIKIVIENVMGNQFSGRLHQTYTNGASDIMAIEGTRVGNGVNFYTTGMRLVAGRSLTFSGALVGSRLYAQVSGVAANRKPATGFITARK